MSIDQPQAFVADVPLINGHRCFRHGARSEGRARCCPPLISRLFEILENDIRAPIIARARQRWFGRELEHEPAGIMNDSVAMCPERRLIFTVANGVLQPTCNLDFGSALAAI